jgi:hypothetical protein
MNTCLYRNFDLLIEKSGESYQARVLDSPSGQGRPLPFDLPFSPEQLEIVRLRIGSRHGMRSGVASAANTVTEFGSLLYSAIFRDQVQSHLLMSLERSEDEHCGLRIRLRLSGCPELADVPWEYLYDPERRRFLCLSTSTPVIRFLELPDPVRALRVTGPLRMLVVIANPQEPYVDELDVEREWQNLNEALRGVVSAGQVEIERLAPPTLSRMDTQLRHNRYHVLHFIGHGHFDPVVGHGELLFQDENGRGVPIGGAELGTLLYDHRSLRLAVLNACEGARAGLVDPLAGVAQTLVQQRIPAVVAMQFEISDTAAIIFSHTLYQMLALGNPIDMAVAHARRAIYAAPDMTQWAAPVLHLRAPDGKIFDVAPRRKVTAADTYVPQQNPPATGDQHPGKPPSQPQPGSWRALVCNETKSAMVRATIVTVTLTRETHTITVLWGFRDRLELDGKTIKKSLYNLNGCHKFNLSDGHLHLDTEIELAEQGMHYVVKRLQVDGQTIPVSGAAS